MKFKKSDALYLKSLAHLNNHVSYLLACDSRAKDDTEGLAKNNIIAFYRGNTLVIESAYNLDKRTALAKDIRKKAKESLKNLEEQTIQDNLRMELAYLEGLTQENFTTKRGFEEMIECVLNYIYDNEDETERFGEESFLYVFHLHQDQCPHLHRLFKVDR